MEMMVALFVGYFLYESDASNWWWTGYWLIIGVGAVQRMCNTYSLAKAKHAKEIEEQRKYWEGK
jgi:hypothetical protein